MVFADYDGCFIEVVIPALDGLQQLFEQAVYWWESGGRETVIEIGEGIGVITVYVIWEDTVSDAFNSYDPDPYKRAGQKKQGRENKSHARKKSGWQPRNNRRDEKPRKPKKHTPGRGHSHYVFWMLKWEDEEY